MSHDLYKPEKGMLLISDPYMLDPNFKRTVILLSEHNSEGSIGFILNKSTDLSVTSVVDDFPRPNIKLYYGGPVQTNSIHFIYCTSTPVPGSLSIKDDIYWGGNFDQIKELIINDAIDLKCIRFFMGYSGWAPKQLDNELKSKAWIVNPMPREKIFDGSSKELWIDILGSLGDDYALISKFPEDPSLN